jgi:hypothetical protein
MIYDVVFLSFGKSHYIIFCPNLKLLLYIRIIVLRCVGELRCSSMVSYV